MSTGVPDFLKRPADVIGPALISTFVQALEFGFLFCQQRTYWTKAESPWGPAGRILSFITLVAL